MLQQTKTWKVVYVLHCEDEVVILGPFLTEDIYFLPDRNTPLYNYSEQKVSNYTLERSLLF